MEEIGDDFGDLYADIEAQVTSAIDSIPVFTKLNTELEDDSSKKSYAEEGLVSDSKNFDSIGAQLTRPGNNEKTPGFDVNVEEEVIVDNGSDSEDDLNIVLNDEDCRAFPVTGGGGARNEGVDGDEDGDFIVVAEGNNNRSDGLKQVSVGNGADRGNGVKGSYHSQYSQYKYIRSHSSNAKGNGSFASMFARADREDNELNQYRGSTSDKVGPIDATALPAIVESGCGFSLPRYRTIIDVDIDSFEQKPWRHPGVDITDFFNFGFDEQSWNDYCYSVHEKVAQETVVEETGQAGEGRTDARASKIASSGMLELPKGRAIQVEGSIGERQPSMDVRRPRIRDTGVVIQITVQDSLDDSSGSGKEDLGHEDSTLHEASENLNFSVDDNRNSHFLDRVSGDELSTESLEGSVRRFDMASSLKRCSHPMTPSNPTPLDSDNHVNDQNSNVDGRHHERVDVRISEGNADVIETQNKMEKGVGRNSCDDPCIMETESSLGERVQHSLSLSSFRSHSEASEDDVSIDTKKVQKPLRSPSLSSGTELQESDTCDYYLSKDSKSNGIEMKPGFFKDSVKNGSPIRERQTRCSRRLHGVAESKVHTCDDGGASPIYETKILSDKDYSSVGRRRRKEWRHDFGSYDREDISYYRETELCFNYRDERVADNHARTAYTRNSNGKSCHSSRDVIDPYMKRKWDRNEYLFEQKINGADNEILESDYHRDRGLAKEMDPCTYRESRRLVSKYSYYADKEEDAQWRSEKHYCRKRTDHGDSLVETEHADDFMQEKYRRAAPSIDRGRNTLNEKYERRLQCAVREVKKFGRRDRYVKSPTLDMDYSWPTGIEEDYQRHMDHKYLSSQSCKSHSGNGGRMHDTMSPRDDLSNLRLRERYGRPRTQIHAKRCRDSDSFGYYNDANDTENSMNYPDDQVHFGRRKYSWKSRELHWTEEEFISGNQDDEWYGEEASVFHERIAGHERIHAKHGSAHGRMLNDAKQFKQHRCKMIKEGNSSNFINRSSNIIHRVKHEQTVLKCRDSVDVVVGGGKSSGRCSKAASIKCNGRPESLNSKIDKEHSTFKDFNRPHTVKAVQPDITKIGSNQDNQKWHRKFPVTEHNEALDLEEGQILTEEPDEGFLIEKNLVSESAALTGGVKKIMLRNENAANRNKTIGGYDNHRLLETLAKMEKRGERFKEPLNLKKEQDKNPNSQVDPIVETEETKQKRPARKRRWVGS